jgi:manganese/zinc/iron transport system substrate-binding protein
VLAGLLIVAVALSGCAQGAIRVPDVSGRKARIVTTTNFITDLARQVGGPRVEVRGLMGPGVDPHLFKASARDVRTLRQADLVLYGGLELEGKMGDLFEELSARQPAKAVTAGLSRSDLRTEAPVRPDVVDPHVWFDVSKWQSATRIVIAQLAKIDPAHADEYRERGAAYVAELAGLDAYAKRRIQEIPADKRVLVTSHDAFHYFGERYGMEVVAIQGISTATEATTADIERVARVIADRRLRSVFVESSVPQQTIDAVLASAARNGQPARVGGELYADSAGSTGTPEGTYIGMVKANVDLIVEGLK